MEHIEATGRRETARLRLGSKHTNQPALEAK